MGEALASSIHYASGDRRGGIVLGIARDYSSLRDKGMIFEQVWLLVLISPLVLWMIFASYRSRTAGWFAINIFETLLLFAFGLTGFVLRKSNVAAEALAQALNGLSDTDLKQGKRRIYVIETNNWKAIQVKHKIELNNLSPSTITGINDCELPNGVPSHEHHGRSRNIMAPWST